ncbi:MAG: alanine racemase, partial [Acidimicrobiia bacterium]
MRPSWVEVDLEAIRQNVRALARVIAPAKLCAVVKADGYGHGDVPVAEAAVEAGASWLAVALVEEGVRLREAGVEAPILLLSEPSISDAPEVVRWNLTPTVYRGDFIEALRAAGADRVQIKVDTGMHRVGVAPSALPALVEACRSAGIRVEAMWTHFAVSEEVGDFTAAQIARFNEAIGDLDVPMTHLANTAGGILYPDARRDLVRAGIGIYGIHPGPTTRSR